MQLLHGFPTGQTLDQQQAFLEATIGHPQELFENLIADISGNDRKTFASIQKSWLHLMWVLDAYRVHRVPPRGMGKPTVTDPMKRLDAIYRGKGEWFAKALTGLLKNQTGLELAAQSKVVGMSQQHQIDIAWPCEPGPIRDPLVCIETKLSGAPGFGTTKDRGPVDDYVSRRKEVKFAAADLKLARRIQEPINDWDVWRTKASPVVFFLWGARLRTVEDGEKVISEIAAMQDYYVDGAGLLPWVENEGGTGYAVPEIEIPPKFQLDNALWKTASHIALARIQPPPATP